LPASEDELRQALVLIDRAMAAGQARRDWAYPYFLFTKGLADYRLGRLDIAIEVMTGEASGVMGPAPRLILAMAQHRKGQKQAARRTLAAAILAFDWSAAQADNHNAWICHVFRREAEALILPNLPAFLEGNYQPRDNDERLALLGVCQFKGLPWAAARLYTEIFAADPKLAEDVRAESRYRAACCAALAGCGRGADGANLSATERAHWREQARVWLKADLDIWAKKLAGGPIRGALPQDVEVNPEHAEFFAFAREQLVQRLRMADRALVQRTLNRWRANPDLAGLRDTKALDKLPLEEREACRKLWAAVEALLQQPPIQ
jgi:serine/threonine-protein kinase